MPKRLRRLFRKITFIPLVLFVGGVLEALHIKAVIEIFDIIKEHSAFLVSSNFLIIISTLWISILILGPELYKVLPQRLLIGKHIQVRTWIDQGERHDLLFELLRRCKPGDKVDFISFTGKSVLLPEQPGKALHDYPFPHAIQSGIMFRGLLLDPKSFEADFRSEIESPNISRQKRLFYLDAQAIADLPNTYDNAGIRRQLVLANLQVRYISMDLPFSLWLFSNVALIEPYHVGRRQGVAHLCEFAQMIIPQNDINYQFLESHFQTLWESERSRPAWSEISLRQSGATAE